MNDMKIFENPEFGKLRTINKNGNVMFVASDVAKMLGYKYPAYTISAHCEEVAKCRLPTNGGPQEMKIIPKGDVYRLIVNSKLPTVERFKNWVFNGILSNINESSNDKGLQSPEEALVKVENNQVVTDSRSVADHFGKQHKDVLRAIENLVRGYQRKIAPMFYETTMPDSYGRQQKTYFMNRDGFSLLVMGFTKNARAEAPAFRHGEEARAPLILKQLNM